MGFGHIRRSVTLAHRLSGLAPLRLWIVCDEPGDAVEMISHFGGMTVAAGPQPNFQSRLEILDLEPEAMRLQLRRSAAFTRRLSLDWFDPTLLPDVTINLIDHGGQMRAAYSDAGRPECYLEGPQFSIIRQSLRDLRPETPQTVPQVRHVVVTAGGADPARRTLAGLSDLRDHAPETIRSTVIVGPLFQQDYEAEIRDVAPAASRVLREPKDYDAILSAADVILCSGGGTLLESMCLGKVAVVYPQTPAEENHALFHARAGACVMHSSIAEVMTSVTRRSLLVAKAHQQVDGCGTERIAEVASSLL